ncbi:hypothetical protein B0I72DRAFT_134721 [Yarrowia lipolytica]|jgi:hypothetical protein|uniref:YALI0E28548p n=2 Tax=Yarrowia lipolytica TaxID=4952 RepID=Q6C4A0_YARLI|nr:YALI0E28548p [Yarrowia lipolytica CLIB122]AOW06091.1 hypothetical protein YALI1_E33799g [Yarrowia lipolytica]KAB8285635.1 hypothetical protein BKA91DRAFT_133384 [Yarrowia lipolytica]KAE8175277.1 hypothetical protein BKA90DRAFT_132386 [Yarrowia lipolytica]KAJ8057488.1 hypothetical protein LXG23DRAFT_34368 [Yarrowia lipolytica]QNP99871.1 Hypothetical protein YALI2_E01187g [Yarrowia lipolytica]|eukprot:XP_504512.1 YALI0E28548p [Yarrowia lipolytica CLIB122]
MYSYNTWNDSKELGETILGLHLSNLTCLKTAPNLTLTRKHTEKFITPAPQVKCQFSFLRYCLWFHAAEIQICEAGPQSLDSAWAEIVHFGGASGSETGSWVERRRQAAFDKFGPMRGHQVALETLIMLAPQSCFEPLEFLRVYCMLCEMTDSHYNILDALDKMCVFTNSREPRSAFDREIERVDLDLREWNDKVVHMWIEAKIELKMRALEQRRIMKKKKKST